MSLITKTMPKVNTERHNFWEKCKGHRNHSQCQSRNKVDRFIFHSQKARRTTKKMSKAFSDDRHAERDAKTSQLGGCEIKCPENMINALQWYVGG